MRVLFAILALVSSAAFADTSVRYTVLFQDKPSGEQVTTVRNDGLITVDFSYRDNGRGPDLKEQIRLGADGTPVLYRVNGKSTFGAPVKESFELKSGTAQWRSLSDEGKKAVTAPAAYVPVENSPELIGIAVRAIARQPQQRLAALPDGLLSVEKLTETTVKSDQGTKDLALYSIAGVTTRPAFVWLTRDAEQRFFAFIYPGWMRTIERGWESTGARLEEMQRQAESEWLRKLAQRMSHHLPEPILIRNVRVFDSENARLLEPSDVYVYRGKISTVLPSGSPPQETGTIIDGSGQTLLPALFDMHSHEDPWNLLLQIAGGVTSSRDMGADNAVLGKMIADIEAGELLGPRILPAGYIEGDSPFSSQGGFVVKDVQGARDAIDWYAQRGYRQIKIYNSFRPEWVEPTAAYAHQRGLRVGGHIPAFMKAEEAVRAGYDEIQHINQVLLNFFVTPKTDTRTLARFYLIAEKTHTLDLNSPRVRDFVSLLKERQTVIDLTLTAFESMMTQMQGEMSASFAAVASNVPFALQRSWRTNSMDVTEKNVATYRASYARLLEFAGLLYREGVPIVAGTDDIAGFALHRELELYVKAGIPAAQALRIATWNGAKYTGTLAELGSVAPHKNADLILIPGDPTADISAIRRISLVMKSGTVYYPAEVYESLGVKRFADPPAVQARTSR